MSVEKTPMNSSGHQDDDLQKLIYETGRNGWVFIPEGTHEIEGPLEIHQPNITILGDGKDRTNVVIDAQEKIVITRENVTIRNLSIQGTTGSNGDGVVLKGVAQHCTLDNLKFNDIERYGVYRPQNQATGLNAILKCVFINIGEAGIRAETGSGPLNVIEWNRMEDERSVLIEWGVNRSFLRANNGKTVLTPASANNQVFDENPEQSVEDQPDTNDIHKITIQ